MQRALVPQWAHTGSAVASFLFICSFVKKHLPREIRVFVCTILRKALSFLHPYNYIKLHEYSSERMIKDELYSTAEVYVSAVCLQHARRLKAELRKETDRPLITIDNYEQVTDTFNGAKVWWYASRNHPKSNTISFHSNTEERRYYGLCFHKRHRELIEKNYLQHILKKGRSIIKSNWQRRLFTNTSTNFWSHVTFEHPATFDTLAMDPKRKKMIIDNLVEFREAQEYYKKVGKPWKRGYLLYGPPGTGKSTMITAIANFMEYDVYDLELTAVKSNTDLRKIFLETTAKSIIVIEYIDCSLNLTGKRKDKKKKKDNGEIKPSKAPKEVDTSDKVTLSGLLNFIDGLWSACGGERIIIFTTNHIENLDPALIRRGRMDMHIEMSYCCFKAFKVLAKNYLGIENHQLFDSIKELFSEVKVSPADVAESLMVKGFTNKDVDVDVYLQTLIEQLKETKKEEGKKNAQDQVKDESKKEKLHLQEQGKEEELNLGAE